MTAAERLRLVERRSLDYSTLPVWARGGMRRYFEHAIEPGGGLRAALENDLLHYVGRVFDYTDSARFGAEVIALVNWMYKELPAAAWGSPERVAAWLASRDDEGDAPIATPEQDGEP